MTDIIQKIKTRAKRGITNLQGDASGLLGLNEQFFRKARGTRILVYHGICQSDHLLFNTIFLQEATFEDHLKFYKKYFHVVSLDDYYKGNLSKDRFNICLTFDDGFANNHKYVLPLLEQYQIPAAFFVTAIRDAGHDILWNDFFAIMGRYGCTEFNFNGDRYRKNKYNKYISAANGKAITDLLRETGFEEKAAAMIELYPLFEFKNDTLFEDYWLQMTRQQIKELAASPYATIGAHGYYHNDLAKIGIDDARDEMQRSKAYLEELIQKPVHSLAFPYGTYNQQVLDAAKQAGYKQLLALELNEAKDAANQTLKERLTINPFISVTNQMIAIINGYYA